MSNVFDVKFKMGAIHKVNKLMSNNVSNNVFNNVCNSVYNNEQRCATMCAIYTVQFTKANKLMSNTVIPSNANSNASTAERHNRLYSYCFPVEVLKECSKFTMMVVLLCKY